MTLFRPLALPLLLCCLFFFCLSFASARAQCSATDTAQPRRGHIQNLIGETDTNRRMESAFAGYTFGMLHDSVLTRYEVSRFLKNSQQLWLAHWCNERTITDWEDNTLSDSSRTKVFSVATADTISFFRDFHWVNIETEEQSITRYYLQDSLDFAVELVNAANGQRLELLDSIGVLPCVPAGVPRVHAINSSIKAFVKYSVPSSMNGFQVFLRIRLYDRGSQSHFFMRKDDIGGFPEKPELWISTDSLYLLYTSYYNSVVFGKRAIRDLMAAETARYAYAQLRALPNPSSGRVSIRFNVLSQGNTVTLMIYNATGKVVAMPVCRKQLRGKQDITYQFSESGSYRIGLHFGEELVQTIPVIINK